MPVSWIVWRLWGFTLNNSLMNIYLHWTFTLTTSIKHCRPFQTILFKEYSLMNNNGDWHVEIICYLPSPPFFSFLRAYNYRLPYFMSYGISIFRNLLNFVHKTYKQYFKGTNSESICIFPCNSEREDLLNYIVLRLHLDKFNTTKK